MAQRPVAGKGRLALALLLMLLVTGCASHFDGSVHRMRGDVIAGNWVTVQRGDTLGAIARRIDVPLERLQRFNPGVDPRRLAVGQRLMLPTHRERAPSGGPYRYQVRPGDTYTSIARHFATRPSRLVAANRATPPNALRVGQLIRVPLSGSGSGGKKARTKSRPSPPAKRSLPDPGKLAASASGWPWPLDDYRIVRRFGRDGRGTLQPMLLATGGGARAKAVAEGEVRFADRMRQLGQVVIVHHADNVQSVYALCKRPLVSRGDAVGRGDAVCEVGFNNTSERFDLLFDLRHGGKPVDPATVLR